MTYSQTSSRTFTLALVLALALFAPFASAFPPDTTLGDARESPGGSTLTTAGQERACSEYADQTGVFSGSKTIKSPVLPALINVYSVTTVAVDTSKPEHPECYLGSDGKCYAATGWKFLGEYEADLTYRGEAGKFYAYEIYHCPVQAQACRTGESRAVTETSYQTCASGTWSATKTCASGQYYSGSAGSCQSYACRERWTCGAYGACTAGGRQYRSCEDTANCGTLKDAPAESQACTPVLGDGTVAQSPDEFRKNPPIRLVGKPTLDRYAIEAGESVTVTQEFEVFTPGSYWVEAGVEQLRGFSIADVPENTCDPSETWYANQRVAFSSKGRVFKTFTLTPTAGGEWALHTAIVTGCGGEVLEQQNAIDRLEVASEDGSTSGGGQRLDGVVKANSGLILAVMGIVLVGGMFYFARKRRK